jgi:dethiobiotin synthetase
LPGGLLTPLGPRVTCLDALVALEPTWVVVVASDALGALHHVASALGVLSAAGFTRVVVALSSPAVADGSTGTNAAELAVVGTIIDAVAVGRGPAASLVRPAATVLGRIGW